MWIVLILGGGGLIIDSKFLLLLFSFFVDKFIVCKVFFKGFGKGLFFLRLFVKYLVVVLRDFVSCFLFFLVSDCVNLIFFIGFLLIKLYMVCKVWRGKFFIWLRVDWIVRIGDGGNLNKMLDDICLCVEILFCIIFIVCIMMFGSLFLYLFIRLFIVCIIWFFN